MILSFKLWCGLTKPRSYFSFLLSGLVLLTLSACHNSSDNNPTNNTNVVDFPIILSARQVTDTTVSNGSATGTITVDTSTGAISGTFTAKDLDAAITAAHIHKGVAGVSGSVVIPFQQGNDANTWNIPDSTVLDAAQLADLFAGKFYVNVHSSAHPGGEIRGQIVPATITVIRTELEGQQETIPVNSSSSAVAYITVDTVTGNVIGNLRTTNLDSASAAHIHSGFAGTNGAAAIGFVQDATDITFWEFPADANLTPAQLTQLNQGGMYFNVHSPANPKGDLRGQVVPEGITVVRSVLDGTQQVPANNSVATGVGYTTVNTTTGTVVANIRTIGLDDAVAAHIHIGNAGSNGSVIVPLTQDATDVTVWNSAAEAVLDSIQLVALNSGRLYFNVHTPAIQTGEVRGQITP